MTRTLESINEALEFSLDATTSTNYWWRFMQMMRADLESLFPSRPAEDVGSSAVPVYEGARPLVQYRSFAERLVAKARSRQLNVIENR